MNETRVLHQTIGLGDNPDDIHFEERMGHGFIVLGNVSIAVSTSSQAAVDKFATVVAQAAADGRARALKAVS